VFRNSKESSIVTQNPRKTLYRHQNLSSSFLCHTHPVRKLLWLSVHDFLTYPAGRWRKGQTVSRIIGWRTLHGWVVFQAARRLKLKSLPQCVGLSGGASIELIARDGNHRAFDLHQVMTRAPNCNFSFSGIKTWLQRTADLEEQKYGKRCRILLGCWWWCGGEFWRILYPWNFWFVML